MALYYLLKNVPKCGLQCGKALAGQSLVRSASILSSARFNNKKFEPFAPSLSLTKVSPITFKTVNLSQVNAFSVTSRKLSAVEHDHTKLWNAERVLSAALLGISPAAFMFPSSAMDILLAVTLVMHNHWGIEAIVIDYVRPIIFGNFIPKVALGLTYAFSIVMLVGLFYLIFNSSGLVNTIQILWKI